MAQSAQGWIDQCNMTHGPPSSRMIEGMLPKITVSTFICSTLFIVHTVLSSFKNNSVYKTLKQQAKDQTLKYLTTSIFKYFNI